MTYRELLRRVCRVTGDEEPTCELEELVSDRHIQLGEFFNQVKDEVEAAHNWRALRKTIDFGLSAGASSAQIVDANTAFAAPRTARVVRIHDAHNGMLIPLVWDITDPLRPIPLHELDLSLLAYKNVMHTDQNVAEPVGFAIAPDGDGLNIHVWPTPSTGRALRVVLTVPQTYMDIDDLDTEIYIPNRAVLIGTIWYALQERGEELGISSMYTEERYRTALDAEIATDAAEQGEYELVPV